MSVWTEAVANWWHAVCMMACLVRNCAATRATHRCPACRAGTCSHPHTNPILLMQEYSMRLVTKHRAEVQSILCSTHQGAHCF